MLWDEEKQKQIDEYLLNEVYDTLDFFADRYRRGLEGVLTFHSETGTEGGYWAFQDSRYIIDEDNWDQKGLYVLRDMDYLMIFDPETKKEVWSGGIDLNEYPPFKEYPALLVIAVPNERHEHLYTE